MNKSMSIKATRIDKYRWSEIVYIMSASFIKKQNSLIHLGCIGLSTNINAAPIRSETRQVPNNLLLSPRGYPHYN